jgi:hypothetical protein
MKQDIKETCKKLIEGNANEAQTRHEVIDCILHELFAWPRALTKVEEFIAPGFSDYVLTKPNGDFLFFVEAKKAGKHFSLPVPHKVDENHAYVSIKTLLTDANIAAAMKQVREY